MSFIGRFRTYNHSEEKNVDADRQTFLVSRCSSTCDTVSTANFTENRIVNGDCHDSDSTENSPLPSSADWISDFNPRSKEEVTRNCVTVSSEIKSKVIHTVFEYVLNKAQNQSTGVRFDGSVWRKGGSLLMGEVVGLFDKELLLELKNECGGLQTLLRNHCHIFQGKF